MVETPIQMRDVIKHQQNACMITEASYSDFVITSNSIEKGKLDKRVLETYLAKSRGDGSKQNVLQLLQLESKLEKGNMDSIVPYFTKEIVPHVKDMNDLLVKLEGINISEDKKESIRESVKDAKVINRIIKNHEVISKNMNLESEVNYYDLSKDAERFITHVCETVNKLKAPQYALMNIALEEVLYDNYKYGLAIPKKYCVETVTDYFLFQEFDEQTLSGYIRLLKENRCISFSDCENINYLFESETFANADDIRDLINKYKKDDKKNASKLDRLVKKVYGLPPESVINETPTLFGVIRASLILPTFAISPVLGLLTFMTDRFIQFNVRRKQADKMKDYFINELNKVEDKIDECFDDEKKEEKLKKYYKCLEQCSDKITMYRNSLYTDKELEKEWDFEESSSYIQPVRLNEFKQFKFNNLMDVAKYANKYIETVYKRATKAIKDKFNKSIFRPIGECDTITESNLLAHIDSLDNRISICIESFEFSDVNFAHEEMTRLCESLNNSINNSRYLFFYEYASENRMELYLKEATPIILTEQEEKEQASMFAGMDFERICDIQIINELMNNENLFKLFLSEAENKDNISFSKSSRYKMDIINSLSASEKKKMNIDSSYTPDNNNSIYTEILLVNGKPAAYIDVDEFPKYKGEAVVGIATHSDYRRKGYAEILIKRFLTKVPKHITKIVYPYHDSNSKSKKLATKMGFKFWGSGNDGFSSMQMDPKDIKISESESYIVNTDYLLETVLNEGKIKDKITNKTTEAKNNVSNKVDKVKDGANKKVNGVKEKLSRKEEIGESDSKEKGFKGVNLNSIILAIEGSKKKAKDLSAKEQEMSRQLDYTANHLVKSVERTMTSDRREGLIKGSVIPSFSKTLKWCLGLAAVGYASPGLAAIGAIGALANSKRLNHKERALLLDEIEIELKVVEKEINIAESESDMKKLRTLMQYQRSLQREYQRLKYNMKVHWQTPTGKVNTNVTHNTIGRNFGIKGGGDD